MQVNMGLPPGLPPKPPQIASIGRRPPNECAPIEEKLHVSRPSQNSSSSAASKSSATSQAPASRPARRTEPDAVSITSNLRRAWQRGRRGAALSALLAVHPQPLRFRSTSSHAESGIPANPSQPGFWPMDSLDWFLRSAKAPGHSSRALLRRHAR